MQACPNVSGHLREQMQHDPFAVARAGRSFGNVLLTEPLASFCQGLAACDGSARGDDQDSGDEPASRAYV